MTTQRPKEQVTDKPSEGKKEEVLTEEARNKLQAIDEVEQEAMKDAVEEVKGQLSPFVKRKNGAQLFEWAFKYGPGNFSSQIEGIYKESINPIREEVRTESRGDIGRAARAQIGGMPPLTNIPRKTSVELADMARQKGKEVGILLRGWVSATIKAYDKPGKEEGQITVEIFQALTRGMPAISQIAKEKGPERKVLEKLLWPSNANSKNRLTDAEYEVIVDSLQPKDMRTKDRYTLEASKPGMMIGLMMPAERMRLSQIFIKRRPGNAKMFVDALIATNILTISQGEALYKEGNFGKMDKGGMQRAQETFTQAIRREGILLQSNGYYNVAAEQLTLKNAGLALGAVWGGCTIALNGIVELMGTNGSIAGFLTNPYVYMGAGAAAAAGTILSGNSIEALLTSPGTDEKTRERASTEEKALMEIFGRYPEIETYFADKGGAEHYFKIEEQRRKKMSETAKVTGKGQKGPFKDQNDLFTALMDDTSADRKGTLQIIQNEYGDNGKAQLLMTVGLIGQMAIKGQKSLNEKTTAFNNLIKRYREQYGVS